MFNLIHTVPSKFLPEAGAQLILRGLEEAEAIELIQKEGFTPYIRSFLCCQVLTGRIGVKIRSSKKACPLPTKETPTLIAAPNFRRKMIDPSEVLSEEEILATPVKWMLAELS